MWNLYEETENGLIFYAWVVANSVPLWVVQRDAAGISAKLTQAEAWLVRGDKQRAFQELFGQGV